jgi:light-regulated signal transduction histidine kinase (bacteriophytochrome)
MDRLIEDLLAFSRMGRQPLEKERVDMNACVRQVVKDFADEVNGRRVNVIIEDLHPCYGDPALVKQVYTNLLSNALKFTRRRKAARIEIGERGSNGDVAYYVKDNGVGLDQKYADSVFGVFKRIDPDGQYEGTGVGLAIVQHIVQRHGGRAWIEGRPRTGVTAYFTLAPPKRSV